MYQQRKLMLRRNAFYRQQLAADNHGQSCQPDLATVSAENKVLLTPSVLGSCIAVFTLATSDINNCGQK